MGLLRKIDIKTHLGTTCQYVITGGLEQLEQFISAIRCTSIHIIADKNAAEAAERMSPGVFSRITDITPILLDSSEANKSLNVVEAICMALNRDGADKDSLLVAVGGGVVTDLVGFVASVYKRGLRFVNVPTTLLAQVDAAIGGKTGVNLKGMKNMLGTITVPEFIYAATDFLDYLPFEEFSQGASEIMKSFVISSRDQYDAGVAMLTRCHEMSSPTEDIAELICSAVSVKARIVSEDYLDNGTRHLLNLGHTFGHAIEYVTGGVCSHGESVAMGMVMAARASEYLGIADEPMSDKFYADFTALSLFTHQMPSAIELLEAMIVDKKKSGEHFNLVLPRSIGNVCIYPVHRQKLLEILSAI